jgi:hypothetical protein
VETKSTKQELLKTRHFYANAEGHEYIEFTGKDSLESMSLADRNLHCLARLKEWLVEERGLEIKPVFPWLEGKEYLEFVASLVNGFCLQIQGVKVVFIPSDNSDIEEMEIPQEWVDLPNWQGDYYVPIRVGTDGNKQFLHLWGFISDEKVRQIGRLDSMFRYYYIRGEEINSELDTLWMDLPEARTKPVFKELSPEQIAENISSLVRDKEVFSRRLHLSFEKWGNILNKDEYLQQYYRMNTAGDRPNIVTKRIDLSAWLNDVTANVELGWQAIETLLSPSPPQVAFPQGMRYFRQGEVRKDPINRDRYINELISQIEKPTRDLDRWQAADLLWEIDPQHPQLPFFRIRDLRQQFDDRPIGLTISMAVLPDSRMAILLRLCPISDSADSYLPPDFKLELQDGDGETIVSPNGKAFQAISRSTYDDNYIQLYFTASQGDRFGVRVSNPDRQIVQEFVV